MSQQIIRVFPRRTRATPDDALTFVGDRDILSAPECDEIHVSCVFSWDLDEAHRLADLWSCRGPVSLGGPALGMGGETFIPGQYVKKGYVITSRGCPNHCWFCSVPRREGNVMRELPIFDGYNILDSNLLACSESHIKAVFAMLRNQLERAKFTGGLEAARLEAWHVELLATLRPRVDSIFFAYDTPDDLEPLMRAGRMLKLAGFTDHHMRCYVLIGYPRDTVTLATERLKQAHQAGFMPMAMLWRDHKGKKDPEWAEFQRQYARPAIARGMLA